VEVTFTTDGLIGIAILFGVIVVIFLIVREIRLFKTNTRKIELELEKDKLSVLKQEQITKNYPFTRIPAEQMKALREIEEANANLDSDLFAKHKLVEGRIKRLESSIKREKLEKMLEQIAAEEKKIV
jgi:hypothetical protein